MEEDKIYADQISRLEAALGKEIAKNRELLSYKHQLDAILDYAPVEIYLKDREGRYLRINRQFEKIFGVRNDDLVGQFPQYAHDSELAATTRDQDLAVLTSGKVECREELARLVSDDQWHTLLTIKFPIFDASGEIDGLGAIVTDITEQKKTQERFRKLVDALEGVVWEADPQTLDLSFISQAVTRLLGYTVDECLAPGFWLSIIHPQDRNNVLNYIKRCHAEGRDTCALEYRLLAKSGATMHVRDLSSIEFEDGVARHSRGIMIDVSTQVQTATEKNQIETRFQQMFAAVPIGIVLVDFDSSTMVEINPAYCKIVGLSQAEIRERGWQSLAHPDDLHAELALLERFKAGEIPHYSIEKRYIGDTGEITWVYCQVCHIGPGEGGKRQYIVMIQDITDRKYSEDKIWRQENYDFLTGLPNRNMLHDRLRELIKRESRSGNEFGVLMIDLDGFKHINDTLGHDKGDELLVQVAARIRHALRASDTVARFGGDEFVVLVSALKNRYGIDQIVDDLNKEVATAFQLAGEAVYISASIGVTVFPGDGGDVRTLIKNADQAMYEAKRLGRNRYHYFTQDMQALAISRLQLIGEMRKAIVEQQFELYYQPIVELSSGSIQKAEALLRWQHPTRGLIMPLEFIPLAEETGLIVEIGDQVFKQATKQAEGWSKTLNGNVQISVNASPVQFENAENFTNFLAHWSASGESICAEITESTLISSGIDTLDLLLKFRDAGVQVALDDFGTGYSSLSYLRKFDIDFLKIDRTFVQNITQSTDDLALCTAIVVMAHSLGIKVIAEGIETEQQRRCLVDIGCDYGQGFLICKPLPAGEFEQFYLQARHDSPSDAGA